MSSHKRLRHVFTVAVDGTGRARAWPHARVIVTTAVVTPVTSRSTAGVRRFLPETEVANTQSLEGSAVRGDDIRVERLGGRDEPRVVLA
jgi:hypothetical protein